jgi:hypothetical protein
MAVYREGYHAVKEIQSKSVQIYSDACDYGVPCRKGDSIWQLTNQLATWYGDKSTKVVNSKRTNVDIMVTLIDEWAVSDERKTLKEATEHFHVSFTTCTDGKCKGFDGFVSVTKVN